MRHREVLVDDRPGRARRACVALALSLTAALLAALVTTGPAEADGPPPSAPLPSVDPFYQYSAPLGATPPGAVLRTRPMTFRAGALNTPITGTQALYRTTDQQGAPTTTVVTVLRPLTPGPLRIVSYQPAYDSLGPECDPSYTLQGNNPSRISVAEQAFMAGYLAAGYTVVVPDYEGPRWEWTVGREAGYAALDGVRAAEALLRAPPSTPVGLLGYSGGSVPTEFAAEVAPAYAPEINLVAAAAGGLPVDLAHNLPYVSGSRGWAGVMPALVVAYNRTYGLGLGSFLSPYGFQLIDQVRNQCIADFAGDYPGLTDAQMVRPPYTSLLQVPSVVSATNANIMGDSGTPRVPLILGVGQSDAVGDTVMVTDDVLGLAHTYCGRGVPTVFKRYAGLDHLQAFPLFEKDAALFLQARFAGGSPENGCATVGVGNSLAPLPVPPPR